MTTLSHEAVTTAELAPATYTALLDTVEIAVLAPGAEPEWNVAELPDGLRMLHIEATDVPVEVRLSLPLGDAAGYWHPKAGWSRTVVADWAGRTDVSLVDGLAAGCLYDHTGATMLTFAAADPVPEVSIRYGVSEENDTYVVHLALPASARPHRLLLVRRSPSVASALKVLRTWYAAELPTMPVPEAARLPLYCTWYAFNQQVDAETVETQAERAAELGFGTLILDDGWQRLGSGRGYAGVGDWVPDPGKFPDFTGHVARVRGTGLKYLAWVAPLLLGPRADCHPRWAPCATVEAGVPGAYVLDPRRPEVRAHVVDTCVRLVREHGLDGLKVDFLDEARVYAGDGRGDIGRALTLLLTELRAALEAVRTDLLLELRQPYVGPGMAAFGNMLRSFDCPADSAANRVRTIDTALLAVGGAVHSDPLLWDTTAPVEAAARQLIGTLHSVPQVSVRLDTLPESHTEAIRFWLGRWRQFRGTLLDGDVEPGRPDDLYTLVRAEDGETRVVTVHGERVVPMGRPSGRTTFLVNGSEVDRLVLEFADGAEVDVEVRGPDGRMIERNQMVVPAGLNSLTVPRMGSATIRGGEWTGG
ncbi:MULTISPECIES: glycoside hydrolase family 36 protein [unclassified Streptomyces]|uniref:glycoside hydrolase family 36 protein n=1 Tax=unclassified Streptomyces TaxID=2593676 RepID=UPI00332A02E1